MHGVSRGSPGCRLPLDAFDGVDATAAPLFSTAAGV
jgi:hypothetical protein